MLKDIFSYAFQCAYCGFDVTVLVIDEESKKNLMKKQRRIQRMQNQNKMKEIGQYG